MNMQNIDPAIANVLAPFSPQIRKLALGTVDRFIKAINAGDESTANAVENQIYNARGNYGAALDAIMEVLQ